MKQNRPAPAYQEYAASMLANFHFRALSLSARGALYTLRLECWVNRRLPADLDLLSKALGLSREDLGQSLSEISPFFKIEEGWLFSIELDQYRTYLDTIREAQSKGGKAGAEMTNGRRKRSLKKIDQVTQQVTRDSLVKLSTDQSSSDQSKTVINGEGLHDEWINEYDDTTYK